VALTALYNFSSSFQALSKHAVREKPTPFVYTVDVAVSDNCTPDVKPLQRPLKATKVSETKKAEEANDPTWIPSIA